jgi:hypothetical protein
MCMHTVPVSSWYFKILFLILGNLLLIPHQNAQQEKVGSHPFSTYTYIFWFMTHSCLSPLSSWNHEQPVSSFGEQVHFFHTAYSLIGWFLWCYGILPEGESSISCHVDYCFKLNLHVLLILTFVECPQAVNFLHFVKCLRLLHLPWPGMSSYNTWLTPFCVCFCLFTVLCELSPCLHVQVLPLRTWHVLLTDMFLIFRM